MGKNHPNVDPYVVSRVRALESLLLEKGILAPDAVDRVIERYEADTGPMVGARAVARAWTDPQYKRLLLDDPRTALARFDLDYAMLMVVENTDARHNLVVCTLCSCYPWPVLGLPPTWYKSPAYRSRAVIDPRGVLADFGVTLPDSTRIAVGALGGWTIDASRHARESLPPAEYLSSTYYEIWIKALEKLLLGAGLVD